MRVTLNGNEVRFHKKIVLWLVIYRIVLELIYVYFASKYFSYLGLTYNKPELITYILTWIMYVFFFPLFIKISKSLCFSSMVISMLFLISYAPSTVMFAYKEAHFKLIFFLYWLFLMGTCIVLKESHRNKYVSFNFDFVRLMSYGFIALAIFIWGYYSHFRIQLSILDVYDLRLQSREYTMPTIMAYLSSSIKNVLPFLVVWSLYKNRKIDAILFIFAQVLFFFTEGSKFTVFYLFFALLAYFFIGERIQKFNMLPFVLSCGGVIGLIELGTIGTYNILSVFYRRVCFVPPNLNYAYYDFFSKNEFDYFRSSFLRLFGVASPYTTEIRFLIGQEYFHNISMSANNGLFSDAYLNMGVFGVVVMPIMVVVLLKVIDYCGDGIPPIIQLALAISAVFSLNGSTFFSNILSHGILLMIILLYFLPRDTNKLSLE